MTVVVGFHCDVIGRQLAWRGVRRGAAAVDYSVISRGCDVAVGLTSICDRRQFC